jgi:hypothetical protein
METNLDSSKHIPSSAEGSVALGTYEHLFDGKHRDDGFIWASSSMSKEIVALFFSISRNAFDAQSIATSY